MLLVCLFVVVGLIAVVVFASVCLFAVVVLLLFVVGCCLCLSFLEGCYCRCFSLVLICLVLLL